MTLKATSQLRITWTMMIQIRTRAGTVDDVEEGDEAWRALSRRRRRAAIYGAKRFGCASARITAKSLVRVGPFGDRRPAAGEQQQRARRAGRICGCSRCGSMRPWRRRIGWPVDRELDVARGDQMHLDPRQHVVPARLVAEGVERDVAVELAVDPLEQVEVELGGDAFRVVIGRDQPLDRLDPVHADQQPRAGAEQCRGNGAAGRSRSAARNCRSSSRGRSRAWASPSISAGRSNGRGEVGFDRIDRRSPGSSRRQLGRALARDNRRKCRSGHRPLGRSPRSRIGVLVAMPAPNSTTAAPWRNARGNLGHDRSSSSAVSVRVG